MGTGGNFDDALQLYKDDKRKSIGVRAQGELDPDGDLIELCVWIVQHEASGHDVAATEMTTTMDDKDELFEVDPPGNAYRKWKLPVGKILVGSKSAQLQQGAATAMAIGLFADANGKRKARQWAQSVELLPPP